MSNFGNIQRLPSGRFRARHLNPTRPYIDGKRNYVNGPSTFRTKTDAQRWLTQQDAAISAGTWAAEQEESLTFGVYAERYFKRLNVRESTKKSYYVLLRNHLLPTFGDVEIDKITPSMIKAWLATACPGAPKARLNAYRKLHQVLADAYDSELIDRNPARSSFIKNIANAPLPEGKKQRRERIPRYLSDAELEDLLEALPAYMRSMTWLASRIGLRAGELIALRSEDIEDGVLIVSHAINRFDEESLTKTGKTRQIVLPPEWKVPEREGYLFLTKKGQRFTYPMYAEQLKYYSEKSAVGHVTPHDLRHTAASRLSAQNVDRATIQAILGHDSAMMTQRYTHSSLELQRRVWE